MRNNSLAAIPVILIVGVLVVLLLFSDTIMGFVSGLPQQIQEIIKQISGRLPGAGGNVTGQTWIGYTVFYADGTSEEIRQNPPSYSLFPLSINFGTKELSSLRVDLKAKLSSDKTMGVWAAIVSMQTEIYKKPETVPKTSATANYTKNGVSWSSGETKILASYTVQASQLQTLVVTYGDGAWQLQFLGHVNLKMTVAGSVIDLNAADPAGGMDFTYTSIHTCAPVTNVFGGSEDLTG